MRLSASLALLALVPATLFTVAAGPTEGCTTLDDAGTPTDTSDDVLACEATEYLGGCDSYEGGKVYHPLIHTTSIFTTPEAPTGSYTSGAGCGTVDDPLLSGTRQDTAFSLDITAYPTVNADTMTVELHDISVSQMRRSGATTLGVRISIEGEYPLGSEENTAVDGSVSESPLTVDVPITAIPSDTGISDALVFTVTNLSDVLSEYAYAPGAGKEIAVTVTIDFDLDGEHTIVWGASEIPSNISFNTEPRGTKIDASKYAN